MALSIWSWWVLKMLCIWLLCLVLSILPPRIAFMMAPRMSAGAQTRTHTANCGGNFDMWASACSAASLWAHWHTQVWPTSGWHQQAGARSTLIHTLTIQRRSRWETDAVIPKKGPSLHQLRVAACRVNKLLYCKHHTATILGLPAGAAYLAGRPGPLPPLPPHPQHPPPHHRCPPQLHPAAPTPAEAECRQPQH